MPISIADSKSITDAQRKQALVAFNIAGAQPLAAGTEAEVYRYEKDTVLKLYADSGRLAHFETLRTLYDSVDTAKSGLRLPKIQKIAQHGDLIVLIESYLDGQPLADLLPDLKGAELDRAEELYLDTAWRLKDITFKKAPETYLLFDSEQISRVNEQSFEQFYAAFLQQKISRVGRFFASLCPHFAPKSSALVEALRDGYNAPLALVHGDFFPGNVLVNENLDIATGVIDFGSFTMFGNHLLDIAGAFAFYKMYDPQRFLIRERLLPKIMARLSPAERPRFYQFLLAHAILTSDLYAAGSDPRPDDHFRWAVEIVCTDHYWTNALN